jgi:hypothetical protein
MSAPKLPHEMDPELEPLVHGSTPEEKEERWAELARRLGSALAHREHTLPQIQAKLTEHDTRLAEHDRQIAELRAERVLSEMLKEVKAMHKRLLSIEQRLPPELKQ